MGDNVNFWKNKRVVLTGGNGFLGRIVRKQLEALDCKNIIVPRSAQFDLRTTSAIRKLYTQARPDMVIHLAAVVGGIGANRENPGKFFYDNLIMGVELIEQARRMGIAKFVAIGTICAYPKFCPVPFKEENIWDAHYQLIMRPEDLDNIDNFTFSTQIEHAKYKKLVVGELMKSYDIVACIDDSELNCQAFRELGLVTIHFYAPGIGRLHVD